MTVREFKIEPAWRPVLKDLGVRPADVLRRAKLPGDLFSQTDARLATEDYFRLWRALETEVDDPGLALKLVDAYGAESFSPLLFAALCSPNLVVAIERIAKYKQLIAPVRLTVAHGRSGVSATFAWLHASASPPRSLVTVELAFLVHLGRMATREPMKPTRVTMPELPEDARDAHEAWLGVRVTRGAQASVRFSKEDASLPFLTADESMWRVFEPELKRRLADLDADAEPSERVRAALLESLPSGNASMEEIARRLGMSKRTLQRRLKREGTSCQQVLASTREQLALHYLGKTDLTCSEISFLLGFEEPNSFFRAFQGWTGDSPERMRSKLAS